MMYSVASGGKGGLTFSKNNAEYFQSNIRMAGDVFEENGDLNNSSNNSLPNAVPDSSSGTSGNTSPPLWSNQYSKSVEQPQSSGQVDRDGALPAQTTSSPQTPVTYDEDQYRYYMSDFGTGTGAEAYAKDMENYNNQHESIKKMPHVHAMFHPDWGRSQKTGGGNPVVAQDYSTKPNHEAGSKAAALFERNFGGSSGGGYKNMKQQQSNGKGQSDDVRYKSQFKNY